MKHDLSWAGKQEHQERQDVNGADRIESMGFGMSVQSLWMSCLFVDLGINDLYDYYYYY